MEKRTFAFKLADKKVLDDGRWKVRDGVALAGCTAAAFGNYRNNIYTNGRPAPTDGGYYC